MFNNKTKKRFLWRRSANLKKCTDELMVAFIKLHEASGEYYHGEKFSLDRYSIEEVLTMLTEEIDNITPKVDEQRLCNNMLNKKIERIQAQAADTEVLRRTVDELQSMKEEAAQAFEELKRKSVEAAIKAEDDYVALITAYIAFRDNLFILKESAEEQNDDTVVKVINSIIRTSTSLLNNCGVEILDATGAFDADYQKIVETVFTDNEALVGTIAETFRCGYMLNNKLLRPQEVKTYKTR